MNIIAVPSPHFSAGRKGYHPEAIVIHIMEGTLGGTDSWFKNALSNVSSHYGIGATGEVHQYVQEEDTAWHAGRVHAPSWSLIKPAGNNLYVNPNYYTIGIEHEGNEKSKWTDAMYDASSDMIAALCGRWNIPLDRAHIFGHHEIYSLKSCPGFKVDLTKLVDSSRQKAGIVTPSDFVNEEGTVTSTTILNLRRNSPSSRSPLVRTVSAGTRLKYIGFTRSGEPVKKNGRWYKTAEGSWLWGGGVR